MYGYISLYLGIAVDRNAQHQYQEAYRCVIRFLKVHVSNFMLEPVISFLIERAGTRVLR